MRSLGPEWNPPDAAGSSTSSHRGSPVLAAGASLEEARGAMVLTHGRGGSAEDLLGLAIQFLPSDLAYLAPQARERTWYPHSFMAPIEDNEPWLTSALETVGRVVARLDQQGFPPGRTFLGGFSQGACLALEFALRAGGRWGGLVGLSGGLIGPPGHPWEERGDLDGTPVFLGCSDRDPHIPLERVRETGQVLGEAGGNVTTRIYPGMGHTVNEDEIDHMRRMIESRPEPPVSEGGTA